MSDTMRVLAALASIALAIATLATAGPLTGGDGAWVGAVVLALTLLAVVIAVWPHAPSQHELEHRELDAIWHELRSDAEADVKWSRYGAWAAQAGELVELWRIERRPGAGAPSPYRRELVARVDPDDIAAAAGAMEALREDAHQRELAAREAHFQALVAAERASYDEALAAVDQRTKAYEREREMQMRSELAAEQAADRAAQAQALARSLRRP